MTKFLAILTLLVALLMACSSPPPETPQELETAVADALRPHKDIKVFVTERNDSIYVVARYRPLVKKRGNIDQSMMDTYKVVYTSKLPVETASIEAVTGLYDSYGNVSDAVIYRTEMGAAVGRRVNWENLWNVDPSRIWDTKVMHRDLR